MLDNRSKKIVRENVFVQNDSKQADIVFLQLWRLHKIRRSSATILFSLINFPENIPEVSRNSTTQKDPIEADNYLTHSDGRRRLP